MTASTKFLLPVISCPPAIFEIAARAPRRLFASFRTRSGTQALQPSGRTHQARIPGSGFVQRHAQDVLRTPDQATGSGRRKQAGLRGVKVITVTYPTSLWKDDTTNQIPGTQIPGIRIAVYGESLIVTGQERPVRRVDSPGFHGRFPISLSASVTKPAQKSAQQPILQPTQQHVSGQSPESIIS